MERGQSNEGGRARDTQVTVGSISGERRSALDAATAPQGPVGPTRPSAVPSAAPSAAPMRVSAGIREGARGPLTARGSKQSSGFIDGLRNGRGIRETMT